MSGPHAHGGLARGHRPGFREMMLSFMLSMLVAIPARAGEEAVLGQQDIDVLHADILAMTEAFERGDAGPMIERTHPSLKAMAGGSEAFAEMAHNAVVQLRAAGVTFVSQEIGIPTPLYPAGSAYVCFVPRVSVMEMQGRRMKSIGYLVAVRSKDGGAWTYLDGAGLRTRPGLLYRLLPDLERDIPLPPNTLE